MPPTQRHTKSRRNRRRANDALNAPAITRCPKCKTPVKPHTVCAFCGHYKGRQVIDVMAKLSKKEKKKKRKEMEHREKEHERGGTLDAKELSKK